MRGNPNDAFCTNGRSGSIPACAGEPPDAQSTSGGEGVYPRVCGGTVIQVPVDAFDPGLSPRVRGNLGLSPRGRGRGGSIPACAGEPSKMISTMRWRRVYPRVCGGTPNQNVLTASCEGLSPRVRGNPLPLNRNSLPTRSIPACAGEPYRATPTGWGRGVYPRVCGGTISGYPHRVGEGGLSPRVRGNPGRQWRRSHCKRSIPACAGEPTRRCL